MEHKSNYGEILRHENEITKLKIQAEFGLMLSDNSELNPAIENIWLNQILDYERSMIDSKKATISELLNNPFCKAVEEINDDEITVELQKLMELLRIKNIVVESVDGVSDREMYRFITKELFQTETEVNFPKNMIVCYIYEEFHPNDEADIERRTLEFIEFFSEKEADNFEMYLSSGNGEEKEIKKENLVRRLNLFRDAFDEIFQKDFEIIETKIFGNKAELIFNFKFEVLPPQSNTYQYLSGEGKFFLIKEYDWWCIEEIVMKGVV